MTPARAAAKETREGSTKTGNNWGWVGITTGQPIESIRSSSNVELSGAPNVNFRKISVRKTI